MAQEQGQTLGQVRLTKVRLDTAEAAEWVINNGLAFGQSYIDNTVQYQVKEKRCHRSQKGPSGVVMHGNKSDVDNARRNTIA
jgi:hypothetical protein